MNHEDEIARGRAFEQSFTVSTALLMKALAGLQASANGLSQPEPIFADLDQTLLTMGQACLEDADDQCQPHLEGQLSLLGDMIQIAKHLHPSASLEDAADELRYMAKLLKLSQKDGK